MANSESNKRMAQRFTALIRASGANPLPDGHRSETEYAISQQQQYEKLRRAVNPAIAAQAQISVGAVIRRNTFAADTTVSARSSQGSLSFRPKKHKNCRKLDAFFIEWGHLVPISVWLHSMGVTEERS
jgi:hypothetical protein